MSGTMDVIAKHAEAIRKELNVPDQERLFRVATEAGYLTALADDKVDDDERAAMIQAIEALSKGSVIEWELESFLDDCAARAKADGKKVGAPLRGVRRARVGRHRQEGSDHRPRARQGRRGRQGQGHRDPEPRRRQRHQRLSCAPALRRRECAAP